MQILLVIIEKDGDTYTGRSPNLVGVSVTGKTRDEVESAVIKEINKRINELHNRHNSRIEISLLPVEETIDCVHKYTDKFRKGQSCSFKAQKDGLCWIHWKGLYSHAFGTSINLKACPLCGESNREILKRWDSPCSFKLENPNWESVLEEKKSKQGKEWKAKTEEIALKQLGSRPRCSKKLSNGKQCVKAAYRNGYCFTHC